MCSRIFLFYWPYNLVTIRIPVSQMRKQRHREVSFQYTQLVKYGFSICAQAVELQTCSMMLSCL